MRAHNHPAPLVMPADLPRDALITYDQFAGLMGPNPPQRATIHRYARDGRFVPGIRMTPHAPMLFRAGAVADFLAARMAGLDVLTGVEPLPETGFTSASTQQVNAALVELNAMIDSLDQDSSDGEVEVVARAIMTIDPPADYRSATFDRFRKVLGMSKPTAWVMLRKTSREAGEART